MGLIEMQAGYESSFFQTDNRTFGQKAGHFAMDAVLNQDARDLAAEEWNNADWNSPWGVAVGMTAGVSYTANTIDAAANAIPLVGTAKGLVETGVKAGIKGVAGIFVKDAAKEAEEILVKTLAPAKRASGSTVLGHYPEYSNLADSLGHRWFDIPTQAWEKMSEAERWAANQKFLDRTISRGDEILLSTPLDKVRPGSYFARELEYLSSKGYRPNADGTRLVFEKK